MPIIAADNPFDFDAAKRLPANIRFGTSTWTYPGWKGLIYQREYASEKEFTAKSLEEYAQFPLFRTVGIDSSFYAPPKRQLLQSYATMVPENFRWVSKVWERITIPKYPGHRRYGALAGKENPDFLHAERFRTEVLTPYVEADIKAHTGPFVFQFPTISKSVLSPAQFFDRLNTFLSQLPKEFSYAIELRNPELLNAHYFSILNTHRATHCFNHWHYMPRLADQMKCAADAGGLDADFYVARILTPLGVSYENAVKLFSPYETLKRENPEMRTDAVRLIKRAVETKKSAFIIVNNRAEGNAPMTIDAIGKMAAQDLLYEG